MRIPLLSGRDFAEEDDANRRQSRWLARRSRANFSLTVRRLASDF
jgi:hypothetical protein